MESVKYFMSGIIISSVILCPLFCNTWGIPEPEPFRVALVLLLFLLSIPVHEIIHGITCAYVSENNWKTIRYGINLKGLHAYCRYSLPVQPGARKIVSIMPCVCLAIIPAAIAFVINNPYVLAYAILQFAGASKDIHDCLKR